MENVDTRNRILMSARELFTEKGYDGTTTPLIARLAGVSQGLIFHYFSSKKKLWAEVKRNVLLDSRINNKKFFIEVESFKSFLQNMIIKSSQFYKEHPDIMRVFTWSDLESMGQESTTRIFNEEIKTLYTTFTHYQQQGQIDSQLNPEFMVNFVLSLTNPLALRQNSVIQEDKTFDSYLNFCVDSVTKAFAMRN